MAPIFKIKLIVYVFIKVFTATTIGKKVIILQVVPSWLLVMLNAKSTAELLISYKKALASILEDKTWHQTFHQPLTQWPLQITEKKDKNKVVGR